MSENRDELAFVHCATCMEQRPDDKSPDEWSQLEVALRQVSPRDGICDLIVACKRCERLVGKWEVAHRLDRYCDVCGKYHEEDQGH